jgi:serine/threonine-protein kinase
MGDIFRATDTALGRTVAIKLLADRYANDEGVRRRFRNEGLTAARLSNSPFTVTIFDVGEADGQPYIVMEFFEGGSLEDQLRAGRRPPRRDVLRWLGQAAAALDAGHAAGVVHRDVKPANLLLDGRGDVHVADFGVASAVGLDSLTVTGTVVGTAGYLSPEQARGERATPASDRYGLGVVAYELFAGRRPFESESPTAEAAAHVNAPVPPLSPELDPVFQRALAKAPDERFPTAAALVGALDEAVAPAPTTRALYDAPPPSRRDRSWAVPVVTVLAVLAALLGGGIALAAFLNDGNTGTRTIVQVTTKQGEPTTVRETVTQEPPPPPPPPSPSLAPGGKSGRQLTDEATGLLGRGRWAEAEAIAREAVQKLTGSGEVYEAYANYDLGRALVEQDRCDEALPYLDRSEQIQGSRREIRQARAKCQ